MEALTKETKQLLKRYLKAASNFYGIIPLYKVLEIYNSQNDPISQEQFLNFIDGFDFDNEDFNIISDHDIFEDVPEPLPLHRDLVAEFCYVFGEFDDYFEVKEAQTGKSYYVPDKNQFLRYEDDFYFEKTLEFISLRAFIRNQSYLTKERADDISDDIVGLFAVNGSVIEMVVQHAIEMGLKIDSEKMADEFEQLCCDVMQNTRMYIHCGHTPVEIYDNGF